jgi:hypothetical protein
VHRTRFTLRERGRNGWPEEGRAKQRIIANLGRKEVVVARGVLDRLARSVARLTQRSMVLSLGRGRSPAQCKVSADWTGAAVRAAVA